MADAEDTAPTPEDDPVLPEAVLNPAARDVRMIPIHRVRVVNPRARSKKIFADMVDNISALGLKRPITVTQNGADDEGPRYDLVCGQGRLEAYRALDEAEIPAIVIEATEADCYLMSLVENLARRRHTSIDLLTAIAELQERGYRVSEIAEKTNLHRSYVSGILYLLREGEARLIDAVEKGWLSIKLAISISRNSEAEVQEALIDAYENKLLGGNQLMRVRALIDRRKALGKSFGTHAQGAKRLTSTQALVRAYQSEVRRQKLMIRKAEIAEQRLLLMVTAIKQLLGDENFVTLLRAEQLDSLPKYLADEMKARAGP